MEMTLDMRSPASLVIGATGAEEIIQNVRTILSTVRGTVPLDRDFGVSATMLDRPLPEAMAVLTSEYVREVERREPRVRVVSVDFKAPVDSGADGALFPVVRVQIKEKALG